MPNTVWLINNDDSSVHSLARYAARLGYRRRVIHHTDAVETLKKEQLPQAIILANGLTNKETKLSCRHLVEHSYSSIPILAMGPGYHSVIELFGGRISPPPIAESDIENDIAHNEETLFMGLPSPFRAACYHPFRTIISSHAELNNIAYDAVNKDVMAVRHEHFPIFALKFHIESILTPYGLDIFRNFMIEAESWHEGREAA